MKKLYDKNELTFALINIGAYVFFFSLADLFSDGIGLSKVITAPLGLILSLMLYIWIRKNGLMVKYGLCGAKKGALKPVDIIFLVFIVSANLWNGIPLRYALDETALYVVSMLFVGFIEEVIFRGFLFKALCKESLKTAIFVSSLTFGVGHIVNLFNGADVYSTLLQICYAAAIGFAFTMIFIKKGSIVPCIVAHSVFNGLSVFSAEASDLNSFITSAVLVVVPLLYGLYLNKKSDKILDN